MFHVNNIQELGDTINRLMRISVQEHRKEKDLLAHLALRELMIRLMQTQAKLLELNYVRMGIQPPLRSTPFSTLKPISAKKIDLNRLHEKVHEPRQFLLESSREEFGIAPVTTFCRSDCDWRRNTCGSMRHNITEVCYLSGFQNLHYFIPGV